MNRTLRSIGLMAAVVSISSSVVVGASGPAAAAYPTTNYTVTYGNSQATGVITWYNRSVYVENVNLRVAAGRCYEIEAHAYVEASSTVKELDYNYSYLYCNPYTYTIDNAANDINLTADVAGGANRVDILLRDKNDAIVKTEVYRR